MAVPLGCKEAVFFILILDVKVGSKAHEIQRGKDAKKYFLANISDRRDRFFCFV
jgi:hypothetical protein